MMIDDIEFWGEPKTVLGYNVYKNGVKQGETLGADVTSFGPVDADNDDLFYVTTIYEEGESLPSNLYGVTYVTGIEQTITKQPSAGTSTLYDLNGRSMKGQLRPGIYLYKSNGQTRKMIIR